MNSWLYWHMLLILVLGKLKKEENCEFEISLEYTASLSQTINSKAKRRK
jgi:hypothetical protein